MNPTYSTIPTHQRHPYAMTHQQLPYVHQQQQFAYVETEQDYPDVYNTPGTAYVQDNSIYEHQQPQQQQHYQPHYMPTALSDQYMLQILHQTGSQGPTEVISHHVKVI